MEQTKYPVVLVHGMIAKDFPFWRAFRGITGFLKQQGIRVYVSNQDGIGAVATNAAQLKNELLQIMEKENCQKVNLIAHSKGGLDARYMISCLDMADRVASLTTLSTPHRGSGLSAWILKIPNFLEKIIAFFADLLFRLLGDKHPDLLTLAYELTAEKMEDFNRRVLNAPQVYYQSFSSTATDKNAFLRSIPYNISRYCEHDDTDGMVSVKSSKWGNYRGGMAGQVDHFQMAGAIGSERRLVGVGIFYLHVIQELQEMGF